MQFVLIDTQHIILRTYIALNECIMHVYGITRNDDHPVCEFDRIIRLSNACMRTYCDQSQDHNSGCRLDDVHTICTASIQSKPARRVFT